MDSLPPELTALEPVVLPAGTVLAREGQRVATIYVVESGLVSVTKQGPEGDVLIGYAARGHVIGASCAIRGLPHATTAWSLHVVHARPLSVAAFQELRRGSLPFAAWLHERLAMKIEQQVRRLVASSARSGEARLLALLVELFGLASELRADGSRRLLVTEPMEHLASGIGVSRERASRALSALAASGVVGRDGNGWLVAPAGSPIVAALGPERGVGAPTSHDPRRKVTRWSS